MKYTYYKSIFNQIIEETNLLKGGSKTTPSSVQSTAQSVPSTAQAQSSSPAQAQLVPSPAPPSVSSTAPSSVPSPVSSSVPSQRPIPSKNDKENINKLIKQLINYLNRFNTEPELLRDALYSDIMPIHEALGGELFKFYARNK